MLRFALLLTVLIAAVAAFRFTGLHEILSREAVAAFFDSVRHLWWAPIALIGLYVVISPLGLPISPLVLAGGIAFGIRWGSLYNSLGALLGAMVTFGLGRALGHDLVAHILGESRLTRFEKMLERHGFWTIARSRFFAPFALVNYTAAIVGVRTVTFLTATITGLVPSVVIYTYFGHALFTVATQDRQAVIRNLVLTVALLLLLTFLVPLRARWKKRRYRPDS